MAAPEAVVNIYDASFGGTDLDRATNLTLDSASASVVTSSGDNELFPTIIQVVQKSIKFSVQVMDVVSAIGLAVGQSGTFTCKLAALGAGAAQLLTITNALCTGVSASSAYGSAGAATVSFEAASSDGTTSPLSIADVA